MTTAELVARLVAVDSTNPDLVAGGAGEAGVAGVIAAHMTELGLEVDRLGRRSRPAQRRRTAARHRRRPLAHVLRPHRRGRR